MGRNQHFIPRFYLRNFHSDPDRTKKGKARKIIGLYNFMNDVYCTHAAIGKQGSSDWFYDDDNELEDALSKEESVWSYICEKIIESNSVPPRHASVWLKALKRFVFLQHARTAASQRLSDQILDVSVRKAMSYDSGMAEYKDIHFKMPQSVIMGMDAVLKGMHLTDDLLCKLIINNRQRAFITSDHPVIRYNQFLEHHRHQFGSLGMGIKGLQVFLPISPYHQLMVYDGRCYKVGNRRDLLVEAADSDIDALNKLQVLNCDEQIFFQHISHDHLNDLKGMRDQGRNHRRVSMDELGRRTLPNGEHGILLNTKVEEYRIGLRLSFTKLTDHAKAYKNSGEIVVFRKEEFADERTRMLQKHWRKLPQEAVIKWVSQPQQPD